MSEKDNIKLKTDTLSSRKSSASVGVHVKRKRKIIAKSASEDSLKKNDASAVKKEVKNSSSLKKTKNKFHFDEEVLNKTLQDTLSLSWSKLPIPNALIEIIKKGDQIAPPL